jgi:hypothetical protein
MNIIDLIDFCNFHNIDYDDYLFLVEKSKDYPIIDFVEVNKIVDKNNFTIEDLLLLFKNKKHLDQNLHVKYKLENKYLGKEMEKYKWFILLKS